MVSENERGRTPHQIPEPAGIPIQSRAFAEEDSSSFQFEATGGGGVGACKHEV